MTVPFLVAMLSDSEASKPVARRAATHQPRLQRDCLAAASNLAAAFVPRPYAYAARCQPPAVKYRSLRAASSHSIAPSAVHLAIESKWLVHNPNQASNPRVKSITQPIC
jgi:hypothetical protein